MLGTIVNAAAVAAGAALGLIFKRGIKQELSDSCMKAVGVTVFLIGLTGALKSMITVGPDGSLSTGGELLLLISLVLGTLAGEAIKLHDRIENLSSAIEKRFSLPDFSRGFVTSSILFCAGAMAIIGAFNDGLLNDHSVLFVKSAIDAVSAVFLASTLGTGVIFSSVVVLVYEGLLTLCSGLLEPVMSGSMLSAVCLSGYVIVMCLGLNLTGATKIKTTNMVLSLPVAALLTLLPWFKL